MINEYEFKLNDYQCFGEGIWTFMQNSKFNLYLLVNQLFMNNGQTGIQ